MRVDMTIQGLDPSFLYAGKRMRTSKGRNKGIVIDARRPRTSLGR